MLGLLICAALLGLIPASIASSKGHSFGLWWLYGFLLFIIAFIHSLFLAKTPEKIEAAQLQAGMQKCHRCAEYIKADAKVCRFCQAELS